MLNPGLGFKLLTILTLTTGTAFIMWLGRTDFTMRIGNGISLIIFAGIVAGLLDGVGWMIKVADGSLIQVLILTALMVVIIAFVVFVERGQRKIPIQYAKRMVGRKVYGGQSTFLPCG